MGDAATVARRVVVHGRVQGVFFRDTCRREALGLGVVGYVRNEADGTVTAEFEGSAPAVEAMVEWARRGPRQAAVVRVEVAEIAPGGRREFQIL